MSEKSDGRPLTTPGKEQLGLPFDQYQRYKIVVDALDVLREDSGSLRVLDVGGGEEGIILRFLPDDSVEVLDQIEAEDIPGYVRGDATALPYEDGAFDYVTSVDTYEHIEKGERRKYLSELRRVARKGVLLAAPFDSEGVRGAEKLVNGLHRAIHKHENVWLREHEENGIPDLDETREYFEEQGDRVSVLPNGYLPHWTAMISLTFYESRLTGGMQGMAERINAFYNEFMYGYDNAEPSYRHLLVALKEDRSAGFEWITSPPDGRPVASSAAFFSMFSTILPLTSQLKELEDRLAQKDTQLVRKETQIRDLSMRLAQQTVSANDRAEIATLKSQRHELRKQLDAVTNSRTWRMLGAYRKIRLSLASLVKRGGG
jgi:hypothetical protein